MNLWQLETINGYKYVTDINKVDVKEYLTAKKIEVEEVCKECGSRLGKIMKVSLRTWKIDNCPICGRLRGLSHVRNFNYLRK